MEVNLLDDGSNESQICVWHFETTGDDNPLMEPRKYIDRYGHQVEIDSCRLCLELFPTNQMVDADGKLGGARIKSLISESVETDFQWNAVSTLICTGCLVRLDLLTAIKNDFLSAALKLHHLMDLVQQEPVQKVEVDVEIEEDCYLEETAHDEMSLVLANVQECFVAELDLKQILQSEEEDYHEEETSVDELMSDSDERNPPVDCEPKIPKKMGRPPKPRPENPDQRPLLKDIVVRKCYICPELLADNSALAAHLIETHSSVDYEKCSLCSQKCSSLPSYNRHLSRHDESERPFKCSSCPLRFADKLACKQHMNTAHDGIPRKTVSNERPICEICGKSFISKTSLRMHVNGVHKEVKKHSCKICQKTFRSNFTLERHMLLHTDSKPFSCNQCDESFRRALYLRCHMRRIHEEKKFVVCPVCSKEFNSYNAMYLHKKAVHFKAKRKAEEPGILACKLCDHLASSHELRKHIVASHANEAYPFRRCSDCPRTFLTYTAWYAHKSVHNDKYACQECGKRFASSHQRQTHVDTTHMGGKRWECPQCPGKQFKTTRTLNTHMGRTHGTLKAHACEICQKRFNRKDNLDTHRRIHTGEKPFECDKCSMRFGDPSTAHKHKKRCGGDQQELSKE